MTDRVTYCTKKNHFVSYVSGYSVPDGKVRLSATKGPYPGESLPGDQQLFDSHDEARAFAIKKGYLVVFRPATEQAAARNTVTV